MADKSGELSWAERMKALRAQLKRPLTLEELMDAGRHYRSADDPRGRPAPGTRPEAEAVEEP